MMKVSVLVPVYGVEKYVGQCAKTLFGQTYNDIEYVFVDDCTPDRSTRMRENSSTWRNTASRNCWIW